jgi:hypothetical protein
MPYRLIGDRFGIGDSAMAQSCSRFSNEIQADHRLRRQMGKIERRVTMCNVETPMPLRITKRVQRIVKSRTRSKAASPQA